MFFSLSLHLSLSLYIYIYIGVLAARSGEHHVRLGRSEVSARTAAPGLLPATATAILLLLLLLLLIIIMIMIMLIIILILILLLIVISLGPISGDTFSSLLGKGQPGSALTGSLRISFFDRGTFWILLLTCFYLPKSARAYLFSQSVKIRFRRCLL